MVRCILKQSDWMLTMFSPSKCFKLVIFTLKSIKGLDPGLLPEVTGFDGLNWCSVEDRLVRFLDISEEI